MTKNKAEVEKEKQMVRICLILDKYYHDITPSFVIEKIAREIIFTLYD